MLETTHRLLDEAGASHLKEVATRLARPAVALTPFEANDDDIPLGASKFGGGADHARDRTRWPHPTERPFPTFLAQINLAEVAPFLEGDPIWPSAGLLLFFAQMEDEIDGTVPEHMDAFHVRSVSPGATLTRVAPPTPKPGRHGPSEPAPRLRPWRLKMHRVMTMPDCIFHPAVPDLGLPEADRDQLNEALMDAAYCEAGWTAYRFGGYPVPEQDSPEEGWCLRTHGVLDGPHVARLPGVQDVLKQAAEWRLLLEIEVNEPFGVDPGPIGTIYFGATEQSISDATFQTTWMERQFD